MTDAVPLQYQYDEFEGLLNQKLAQCFEKKRPQRSFDNNNTKWYRKFTSYLVSLSKEGKVQRLVSRLLMNHVTTLNDKKVHKIRADKIKNVVETLSPEDCFSSKGFWKLKKSLNSKDLSKTSVIDNSGVEVYSDEAIVNAYRQEFQSRLATRPITPDLEQFQHLTNTLVQQLIEYYSNNPTEPEYSLEEVYESIVSFRDKKGKATGTDFIPIEIVSHGGDWLITTLWRLVNMMKRNVTIPNQFNNLSITAIHKNGSQKLLINKRGIFLSSVLCKLKERLIKNRIEKYLSKVNLLQAGSRNKRSTADCHFLIRGLIDHALYVNKPVYLTLYDYSQCFDSLWLQDSLLSLWKVGVRSEMLSLIWKLNEEAKILINTPNGNTEPFMIKTIVKQGSVLGSNLCSTSTAEFCNERITGGVNIGSLNLSSSLFVDDSTTIDGNADDKEQSHEEIEWFSKRK